MKAKDLIKILKKDGWRRVRSKSGHLQFKHPVKKGKVTVPISWKSWFEKESGEKYFKTSANKFIAIIRFF